jgi:hypothetical protein
LFWQCEVDCPGSKNSAFRQTGIQTGGAKWKSLKYAPEQCRRSHACIEIVLVAGRDIRILDVHRVPLNPFRME